MHLLTSPEKSGKKNWEFVTGVFLEALELFTPANWEPSEWT